MAEHAAVNRRVVGSSPTRGAKVPITRLGLFVLWTIHYTFYDLRGTVNIISGHLKNR